MLSPFKYSFKVTQIKHQSHDGLDIVGIFSKNVYSTTDGVVEVASWENPKNKKQGFGLYVRIRDKDGYCFYFGHLSAVKVKVGQIVKVGDLIGIEGNTGYSFGSHVHYCIRKNANKSLVCDVSAISGIPNKIGTYNQFVVKRSWKAPLITITPYITQAKKIAKSNKAVVYDEKGKTIYSYR